MFMFFNQFLEVQSQCSFRSPANYEIAPTKDRYPGRWRTLYLSCTTITSTVLKKMYCFDAFNN